MLAEAEDVIRERTRLACAATGGCEVWEEDGLNAVLATDPALGFLRTISGISEETLPAAVRLARDPRWQGTPPVLVVRPGLSPEAEAGLREQGFVQDGVRIVAILPLDGITRADDPDVVDSPDTGAFLHLLLEGYASDDVVTAFIAAEHADPRIRRSLLLEDGVPISAAALSSHGQGVLLGGSATPREHRGKGAQARLLRHGLGVAAAEGHRFAVATAAEGSPSVSNLRRAGFEIHVRQAWR
ncbi:hypothetical protein [Amycolatopsis sp. lyj-112]|uniref:hypothetical protein n=1 Tax=Amycolatopsis sp. lyj-112 TaxID=2789288 RepID=UPI00397A6050